VPRRERRKQLQVISAKIRSCDNQAAVWHARKCGKISPSSFGSTVLNSIAVGAYRGVGTGGRPRAAHLSGHTSGVGSVAVMPHGRYVWRRTVLDAVAHLAAGALDEGRRPTLSSRYNEVLAGHRSPLPTRAWSMSTGLSNQMHRSNLNTQKSPGAQWRT
jgi:hypothetical protein